MRDITWNENNEPAVMQCDHNDGAQVVVSQKVVGSDRSTAYQLRCGHWVV